MDQNTRRTRAEHAGDRAPMSGSVVNHGWVEGFKGRTIRLGLPDQVSLMDQVSFMDRMSNWGYSPDTVVRR